MSKDKVLFIFDDKERVTANAINSGTSGKKKEQAGKEKLFGEIENFHQTKKIQSEDLFFLGHTSEQTTISLFNQRNEQTLGGFLAKDFAMNLEKKYTSEDKKKLKHVYLISCEVGFINDNTNDCLAQKIADELYNQGFQNVAIHAMTNPVDAPNAGMRVRIISDTGISQAYGREIGDIQAISYNAAQIQQEKQGVIDKKHPPYSSIRRSQLIAEWNRPVNTFTPNQLPSRKPTPLKIAAQEKIIYKIDQTIKNNGFQKGKDASKLIKNLSNLRNGLANSLDYKRFLDDEKNRYEKVSKNSKRSSFFKLLVDIQSQLNNECNSTKSNTINNAKFFKQSYKKTINLFAGIETITLTVMELKIDAALMKIKQQDITPNSEITNFIENNDVVNKLLLKAQALENEGSDESRLKAKSIKLILEESKLLGNFNDLYAYLSNIKNANQPTNEAESPSFYQETLNRPRGIIDKILQFFGWSIKTKTAEYFNELLDAVQYRLEVENRPNI